MPLSRHFYAVDDVQASLLYTGSRGISQETGFWCRELIESGCVAEAIAGLFESWLWHRAPFGMDWLMEAHSRLGGLEVTEEDVLLMAAKLSRLPKKDYSLWWLFVREGEVVDRVTPRSPAGLAEWVGTEEREVFFVRALYQGKARSAWWAGEGLPLERWWELIEAYRTRMIQKNSNGVIDALRGYDGLLGYSSEAYDRAVRGCIVLWLCLRESERKREYVPLQPDPLCTPLGRSLPIPYLGLYGRSRRGRMSQKESTVGDLWDIFAGMRGCPYWEEQADKADKADKVAADTTAWDRYFPTDLPDEWTREEKEKSHGVGLLREGEVANLWGYTKRYMMGRCRGVWMAGPMAPIQERLEQVIIPEGYSPFQALLSVSSPLSSPGPVGLAPVHKKKRVVVSYS